MYLKKLHNSPTIRRALKYSGIALLSLIVFTLSGYLYGNRAYKIPTLNYLGERESLHNSKLSDEQYKIKKEALSHPLYDLIPRHREQIRWWDIPHWITWNLFGNDDDGIFAEETSIYRHEPIGLPRFLKWTLRNPLHNFTFYTIGSAERKKHDTYTLLRIDANGLTYFKKGDRGIVFAKGRRSEERRVGKECRSRWSPYQ